MSSDVIVPERGARTYTYLRLRGASQTIDMTNSSLRAADIQCGPHQLLYGSLQEDIKSHAFQRLDQRICRQRSLACSDARCRPSDVLLRLRSAGPGGKRELRSAERARHRPYGPVKLVERRPRPLPRVPVQYHGRRCRTRPAEGGWRELSPGGLDGLPLKKSDS